MTGAANAGDDGRRRCFGAPDDPLMMRYHDVEWGVPVHDDQDLFERIALEGFQAGLSWRTILHKRDAFRRAFDDFNPQRVARFTEADVQRLVADAGIVRNRLKITATIANAQHVLEVQSDFGSFDRYIWQFTGHEARGAAQGVLQDAMPCSSPESDAMSRDLNKRGFRFAGSTICYAFMQSIGMVNDHLSHCWRVAEGGG